MPITRDLVIVYGSTTVGGSTARQIDGYHIVGPKGYASAAVEFSFITTAASQSALATECNTLEAAFRQPRQNLTITLGGNTILSLSHSGNTGFDASPSIIKAGDPADTGLSRHYTVRIDFGMPADNVSTSFRRDSSVTVEYSAARRRRVTISGTYTANTDGTTAYAQYNSVIGAYSTSVLAVIDNAATWEKVSEPQVTYNDTNKVCDFTVVWQENLYAQSDSGLDDSAIVDPVLHIVVGRSSPGDSTSGGLGFSQTSGGGVSAGGNGIGANNNQRPTVFETPGTTGGGTTTDSSVERPRQITVTFSCSFDKSVVSGVSGAKSKYEGALRQFLISQASTASGGGVVLVEEAPDYEPHGNTFTATLIFLQYNTEIIERTITVADSMVHSKVLKPVWNGDPYSRYEYQGPALKQRIVTEEYKKKVGSADPYSVLTSLQGEFSDVPSGIYSSSAWVFVSRNPSVNVKLQGLPGGASVNIAEVRVESVLMRRNKKNSSTMGGGGGTATATGGRPGVAT